MAFKRWELCKTNKELAKEVAGQCDISGFQALLLQTRGLNLPDEIDSFLYPEKLSFDPFTIIDMQKAVDRIEQATANGEMITVYGDYDADGVTATAILYSYLQTRTEMVSYYIPERNREGYGLNNDSIELLSNQGTQLIITVDNGISAMEQVEFASRLGVDVVITDHHVPSDVIPDACAVVDPHRIDCTCSFKDFAGVGVALMLICALEGADNYDFILDTYSDLACIGTVADIVPLTGINRAIVKCGIDSIRRAERVGINAIIEAAGQDIDAIDSESIAFRIAPRINALGRLGSSANSVELLLCDDYDTAHEFAESMNRENERRRRIENEVLEEVEKCILLDPDIASQRVIVVDGKDWHGGVIGIAASKLVERFGKPCIIISCEGDTAKGSGRSIKGFSLYNALSACSDILLGFGGHELAAGLTVSTENIKLFRQRINDYAREHFPVMPVAQIELACKLNPSALNVDLVQQVSILEPFGSGNSVPIFAFCALTVTEVTPLSGGKHLRISLVKNGSFINAMLFFKERKDFPFDKGDVIDIAVTLNINEFRGRKNVTTIIKDFRPSGMNQEEIILGNVLFDRFNCGECLSNDDVLALLPDRDDLATVYRYLRSNNGWHGDIFYFPAKIGNKVCYSKLLTSISVLKSKNLVSVVQNGANVEIGMCEVEGRVDIESSEVFKKLRGGTRYV